MWLAVIAAQWSQKIKDVKHPGRPVSLLVVVAAVSFFAIIGDFPRGSYAYNPDAFKLHVEDHGVDLKEKVSLALSVKQSLVPWRSATIVGTILLEGYGVKPPSQGQPDLEVHMTLPSGSRVTGHYSSNEDVVFDSEVTSGGFPTVQWTLRDTDTDGALFESVNFVIEGLSSYRGWGKHYVRFIYAQSEDNPAEEVNEVVLRIAPDQDVTILNPTPDLPSAEVPVWRVQKGVVKDMIFDMTVENRVVRWVADLAPDTFFFVLGFGASLWSFRYADKLAGSKRKTGRRR